MILIRSNCCSVIKLKTSAKFLYSGYGLLDVSIRQSPKTKVAGIN